MAAPPFPVCWANRRGAAAIAVAAAPVASMSRLVESIIGALLDHCHGPCVRLEETERCAADGFRYDPWCARIVAQVLLALKGRMPRHAPTDRMPAFASFARWWLIGKIPA